VKSPDRTYLKEADEEAGQEIGNDEVVQRDDTTIELVVSLNGNATPPTSRPDALPLKQKTELAEL